MEIQWYGYNCISLKTKNGTALINPYTEEVGPKLGQMKAQVVLFTDDESKYNNSAVVIGEPKIFSWPGEYEASEIAITMQELKGSLGKKNPILLSLDAEGIRVCYFSELTFDVTDEVVEMIGNVDIMIVPVSKDKGGVEKIQLAMEEIEPRILVPVYYNSPGLKIELDDLSSFQKILGSGNIEPKDKFTVGSRNDLPQEKTEFAILNPQV